MEKKENTTHLEREEKEKKETNLNRDENGISNLKESPD